MNAGHPISTIRDALRKSSWIALAATLSTSVVFFAVLEFRFHYYFLQDDGIEYYLPVYLHNWRSLSNGELPLYNFHTFGGLPHASMGQPAPFYLPIYAALFLSQSVLGHPFAALDLLALMNAILAVAGTFVLLRHWGMSNLASSAGSLTALSGFFFWVGRMWIPMTMLCACFPWIVWASCRFLAVPDPGRAAWVVVARLCLLYGGHSQFFALALIFEHVFALSTYRSKGLNGRFRVLLQYASLMLPTVILGLPLLLPLSVEVKRSALRAAPLPYAEFSNLHATPMLWLMGELFVFLPTPSTVNMISRALPFMSYIGYVPALLSAGIVWLWRKRPEYRRLTAGAAICFVLAFLWSCNLLGPAIYALPILNRFRWPFKLLYFAGFFQCVAAAVVLSQAKTALQRLALALVTANWVVAFCIFPNHAWRVRQYEPPLVSPWQQVLERGRYLVVSEDPRGIATGKPKQLVDYNYSIVWSLDNLLGYEPMASELNSRISAGNLQSGAYSDSVDRIPLDHLKRWSVRYVLQGPRREGARAFLEKAGFQPAITRDGWTLWEDNQALPEVRWAGAPPGKNSGAGIAWTRHVNSIDVSLSQWLGHTLELAFAANPGLQICAEGDCKPVTASPDGLIRSEVRPGTRHLSLVYTNRLFAWSFALALAGLGVFILVCKKYAIYGSELPNHQLATELPAIARVAGRA